jgi:hypothetical protein
MARDIAKTEAYVTFRYKGFKGFPAFFAGTLAIEGRSRCSKDLP